MCDQSDLAEQEDHPSQTGVAIKPLCFLEQLPDESISEKEEGGPSYDMQLYYGRDWIRRDTTISYGLDSN